MLRIALLSDTHGYLDPSIEKYIRDCDEVWHAGDIGNPEVTESLKKMATLRAVYGNIDGTNLRKEFPEEHSFEVEGMKVLMLHIGGYPGHYPASLKEKLTREKPGIFICGHSHILRVMYDPTYQLLHINPGAAGMHGFHQMKTMVRFTLENGNIKDLEAIELGKR